MSRRSPSAARWSKRIDQLVHEVAGTCRPGLQSELGRWMHGSPRFEALVAAHQSKLRKKLLTASSEDARLDVRAEMLVAFLLLDDRRFEVAWETFGIRQAAPDLTVIYRGNLQFNVEVTRLRDSDQPDDAADWLAPRIASVIAGKVRQLPSSMPNALAIVADGLSTDDSTLAAAGRVLRTHVESKDDAFFARRGLRDARAFVALYRRLAGVFVLDEAGQALRSTFSANSDARQPLPNDAVQHLLACFTRRVDERAVLEKPARGLRP
ncbi:MAG: hypothetical protein JOZ81_06650 [Chloroflexi bacterium]|nr:hypothetical protein [Chloroflexota bacterium]